MPDLRLPTASGSLERYELAPPGPWPDTHAPPTVRRAIAAAHVVADPLRSSSTGPAAVDWDATMRFRHHLWGLGFGVAEAMDTAQRGGGLDWPTARELIERSAKEAASVGGELLCGVVTDQLEEGSSPDLDSITAAYAAQCDFVQGVGAVPVVMSSRHLVRSARTPQDYRAVYDRVLANREPGVVLHWLGTAFDPALAGYWGHADPADAIETVVELLHEHRRVVAAIKVSLLSVELECELRRRLPDGVRVMTGDDFNYPELIAGDRTHDSDALLGILDVVAPVAAAALDLLEGGDVAGFRALLEPGVDLSRHLFVAPTHAYKAGVVFLAYLNGFQDHFRMLAGAESSRTVLHLSQAIRLADRARLLRDPDLAAQRARHFLEGVGVHHD